MGNAILRVKEKPAMVVGVAAICGVLLYKLSSKGTMTAHKEEAATTAEKQEEPGEKPPEVHRSYCHSRLWSLQKHLMDDTKSPSRSTDLTSDAGRVARSTSPFSPLRRT